MCIRDSVETIGSAGQAEEIFSDWNSQLPRWCDQSFPGCGQLTQSLTLNWRSATYGSEENLLCAERFQLQTAGKTVSSTLVSIYFEEHILSWPRFLACPSRVEIWKDSYLKPWRPVIVDNTELDAQSTCMMCVNALCSQMAICGSFICFSEVFSCIGTHKPCFHFRIWSNTRSRPHCNWS